MKKRILSLCLLVVMVLPIMVACGKGDDKVTVQPGVTDNAEYVAPYLPEADYNGYEYRFLDMSYNVQIIEDNPVTILDNAIFKRNEKVANKYNVVFKNQIEDLWWNVPGIVQRLAAAEAAEYDLVSLVFMSAYNEIISGNVATATDLVATGYVDMSRPWHKQSLNDFMTFDGISMVDFTAFDIKPGGECIIFNKDIVKELNFEDPYDLVDAGTWTYDVMWQMMKAAAFDLDNDGEWTEDDRYGIIADYHSMTSFINTGAGHLLVNTNNGAPELNKSEALISTYINAMEHIYADGAYLEIYEIWDKTDEAFTQQSTRFMNGNAMFMLGGTNDLMQFGDMEDDYGILPYPKASAEQEKYYTPATGELYVPLACHENLQAVVIIKEALAVESLNYVYPAYYEQTLKNRYLREERDLEILEVITDSVINDLGYTIWWDDIRNTWAEVVNSKNNNFVSALEKNDSRMKTLITTLNNFIAEKKAGN